jgi:hypothetical protein
MKIRLSCSYTPIVEIEGELAAIGDVDDATFAVGTTDANGIWVSPFLPNEPENGTLTLLLVTGFTGSVGDDIDANDDGAIDNPLWTSIVDSIAVFDGTAGDITFGNTVLVSDFDGGSITVGGASRIPNGTDTDSVSDWLRNEFDGEGLPGFMGTPMVGEALNTPGAPNEAVIPEPSSLLIGLFGIGMLCGVRSCTRTR